jgi:hypothetical protein
MAIPQAKTIRQRIDEWYARHVKIMVLTVLVFAALC